MTSLQAIVLQQQENPVVTEEFLSKLINKYYKSGREIIIGDTIISGFLVKNNGTQVTNIGATYSGFTGDFQSVPGKELEMIRFHSEEFGTIYQEDELMSQTKSDNKIPFIKLIQNGN